MKIFGPLFVYFDSQTKICFEEIKASSKFGEKNWGIRENQIRETIWWADHFFQVKKSIFIFWKFSLIFTDDDNEVLEDVENEDLGEDLEDWHAQEERGDGKIITQARFLYICRVSFSQRLGKWD